VEPDGRHLGSVPKLAVLHSGLSSAARLMKTTGSDIRPPPTRIRGQLRAH
jgi:hypothetical protein